MIENKKRKNNFYFNLNFHNIENGTNENYLMIMSNFLYNINESDLDIVCRNILDVYQVKYSKLNLKDIIDNHVDNPSLLTIKDTLFEYGVESAAIKKGSYNYIDFETPFICSIQKEDWHNASFTVVGDVNDMEVTYLEPQKNKFITIPLVEFESIDKGVVLLTDDTHKKDEVNLNTNLVNQRNKKIVKNIPIYLAFTVFVSALSNIIINYQVNVSWVNIVFTTTSFVGLLISTLLLWHDLDVYNPIVREVCGGQSKKLNCDAILYSSQSTFLGVSWSTWGFSYMATLFNLQVFFPSNIIYTQISLLSALIVSPYIFFSLYYQAKVAKQWCPLCLVIQSVLFINFIGALFFVYNNGLSFSLDQSYNYILTLTLFIGFVLIVYTLLPIIKQARKNKDTEKRWQKLRYNPEIFQALLHKNEKIGYPTDNLGIVIGNPNAKNEIIKVCNPYCGPCANAHPELEQIIKMNKDVKIRIIFTASGEESDKKTAPVQHLLAIQEKDGLHQVHQALDDWYLTKEKNYEQFAEKYPMNGELKNQKDKIIAMRDWCNNMKIRSTPTLYINGFEYPDTYKIAELKNFF
ncbi:vitamin K epoxide reductase family protein [Sphingobacterium sp. HJSM2_6]|uniref:vitamin K epoxide reductase family protein n=1 Tax=Sphingobacterium sp. HJSM2_6 TaxID=3366264 RepID=UPI003BD9D3D0